MRGFDYSDHNVVEGGHDRALNGAQPLQPLCRVLRRLVELHDEILDHRRFHTGMAKEAEAIAVDLKERGFAGVTDRQDRGCLGRNRAVTHIDGNGIAVREMTAKRPSSDALRFAYSETERRLFGTAAGCRRQEASAKPYAEDGQAVRKKITSEAKFGAEARKQMAADDAQGTGAQDYQPIKTACPAWYRAARSEGADIVETDGAAFEMILYQAEKLGFGVLEHAQGLHDDRASLAGASVRRSMLVRNR